MSGEANFKSRCGSMKPRERAIRALELEEPDRVPMFELEFQYPEEIIGKPYVLSEDQTGWAMTSEDG